MYGESFYGRHTAQHQLEVDQQNWETARVSNGRNETKGNKLRTYIYYGHTKIHYALNIMLNLI